MPSLSLPVLNRTRLDNSILGTLNRCPRLAFYNYYLCRSARVENYPINFGTATHTFMETLETLYMQWILEDEKGLEDCSLLLYEASCAVALKGWVDPPLEHAKSYLATDRLLETFEELFTFWKNEKNGTSFRVIGAETPFELPLPSGRMFCGKLDQLVEWNGRLWVRDWKTTSRKPSKKGGGWKALYSPDHQFTGYIWASQKLSGRTVDGAIIHVVYNIKTMGPEFYPTLANRTSGDIDHWITWVEDSWDEWERRVETDSWPMNTTACGDWAGCFFRDCCGKGNWSAIERWLEERTIYSVWDPLNPEREEGLPES